MERKQKRIIVPRFKKELGFETTAIRSKLMGKIKGTGTKPEVLLRKALWEKGIRYRLHVKHLPGKPDIVINKYRIVIFVDGEFWHGYKWQEKKKKIKVNRDFWIPKIERNMQRDKENEITLTESGYNVVRFWEHEIKKNIIACVKKIELLCQTDK